jgi:hypothetical protein
MQIVYKEQDRAPNIRARLTFYSHRLRRLLPARSPQHSFLRLAAGHNAFEEIDRLRLAFNEQLKVFGLQATDKLPVFIEDHHVRLHELRADAHDVVLLGCGSWGWCRLFLLSVCVEHEKKQAHDSH